MRRTLSVFILTLTTLVSGCGAIQGSLPYISSGGDATGMTVEQYAVGRLGARVAPAACPKPSHHAVRAQPSVKRCVR